MVKQKKLDIKREYGFLVIEGKYYRADSLDGKPIFKLVSKKVVDKKIKIVDEIIERLKEGLDKEMVLKESLMVNMDNEELENLHNMLYNTKRKYKPKTRQHRCVDMKIGNMILPIVN